MPGGGGLWCPEPHQSMTVFSRRQALLLSLAVPLLPLESGCRASLPAAAPDSGAAALALPKMSGFSATCCISR
jgi:hypothetical protein